jgi:hypothetical protein
MASTESDLREDAVDLDFHRREPRRPLAEDVVDGTGDGNAGRHQRTSPHAEGPAGVPGGRRRRFVLEQPTQAADDDLWVARAYEATPPASRALRVAQRPPHGRPLTPETTTASAADTTGQAPDGARPPLRHPRPAWMTESPETTSRRWFAK